MGSVLLAAGLFVALLLLDVLPHDPLTYRAGQYIPQDIRARVEFRVLSQELQSELLRSAGSVTPPVFRLNATLMDEVSLALKNLPEQLPPATQPAAPPRGPEEFALTPDRAAEVREALADPARRERYDRDVGELRERLIETYVVRSEELLESIWRDATAALMLTDELTATVERVDIINLADTEKLYDKVKELADAFEDPLRPPVTMYLKAAFAKPAPTYVHDAASTQRNIDAERLRIETDPPDEAYKEYAAGQLLVRQSRRKGPEGEEVIPLSEADSELLAEEHRQYLQEEREVHPWRRRGRIVGRSVILLVLVLALSLYIAHYRPRIVKNHWRGLAVALVLLLMILLSRTLVFAAGMNGHSALVAVLLGTIVFTIAYDQRFALALGAALSGLIVLQLRMDLGMLLVMLTGVGGMVFQLHEIRTRSKLIEASAITAGVVLAMICALGLVRAVPWRFVRWDGLWGAGMVLLAGGIVQAVLPAIERVFRLSTSMTLLEWCDASRPLLKRLAMEAPGTYNHSLQLGAMCETAATTIGARGLLARVGAYYHDIGKVNKPVYFVENQADSPSKHDKLSPAMSLLIIIGHVKDGLEMAREYGLPHELHQFIGTHHGTTLVEYFYHAATEQRKNGADRAPEEVEFRYPGPKPRAKETGILMLADAAESSVRAMSQPTSGRIENQVHTMVNRRLMDGQLDECDMTLKEVHQVEASLVKSLCGIYHARIAYPTPPGQKPSAAELERAEKEQEQQREAGSPEETTEQEDSSGESSPDTGSD